MAEELTKELIAKAANRRSFVKKLGIASAAVAAAAGLPEGAEAQSNGPSATDIAVLNFALNLEYLEAEFYSYAVTGMGIGQFGVDVTGSGTAGQTTGGSQVAFTDPNVQAIAQELMMDELEHVVLIRTALIAANTMPIAKPAINLNALGIGFGSQASFLTLSRIFEDIGVSAYGGAAPLLSSQTVGVAARILAVEAEHVGAIRLLMAQNAIPTPALDVADILPPPSGAMYFSTNGAGLTEVRTPGQVLFLAYGGANLSSGGFFPAGANGSFTTSSATAATLDGNTLTINPNPIPVTRASVELGQATLVWHAPSAQIIEIHIGSPTGPLFTRNGPNGQMQTGNWVTNGMQFYLMDASNPAKMGTLAQVLFVATARLKDY
jgi:hypothetical protein